MRFKAGDRVRIKSLDWYNENKNSDDNCDVVFADGWLFSKLMSNFCGKELIIEKISHATNPPHYIMKDTMFGWTDEMIEGLVEEETKTLTTEKMDKVIEEAKTYWDSIKDAWICPQGYQFVDENGNVINATKIVLEKKKKEYPKTYEECRKVLGYDDRETYCVCHTGADERLFESLYCLKVCRDAYWKIAGEEMGLRKPWKPNSDTEVYNIYRFRDKIDISCSYCVGNCNILEFPTAEMRDAFYENFKKEIEICKELL